MKTIRKVMMAFLVLSLAIPMYANVAWAAEGTLQFTDPTTAVGQNVDVTAKMDAAGSEIGDGNVTLTYDATKLQFVSGTNATGGDGTLQLSASGTGSETELTYTMTFTALAEGESKLTVSDYTAYLYDDESLDLTLGDSTVTIGAGDGTAQAAAAPAASGDAGQIMVGDKAYTVKNDFTDLVIPDGFSRTTIELNGATINAVKQDSSEQQMAYLTDGTNEDFFMYNADNATFSMTEQVDVSDNAFIMILSDTEGVEVPSNYSKTDLTLNEKTFPTWQNTEYPAYYLVYALNNSGQKSLYQYDTQDGTYQRFNENTSVTQESTKTTLQKAVDKLKNNMKMYGMIGGGLVLLVLLLILVLAVKLHNRNLEIDDLYEEYHIDDDMGIKKPKKQSGKKSKKSRKKVIDDLNDFDDLDDDGYGMDTGYLEDDEYMEDDGYADSFDDAEYDFIEDAEPEIKPIPVIKKKKKPAKKTTRNDDSSINFIDLE